MVLLLGDTNIHGSTTIMCALITLKP